MERYQNLHGNSGVSAYELGENYIWVEFRGRVKYLYTVADAGQDNIGTMKNLARQGQGLNTYINRSDPPYTNKI